MLNINIGQTRSKHTQVMQYHTRLIPGVSLANTFQYLRYLSFLHKKKKFIKRQGTTETRINAVLPKGSKETHGNNMDTRLNKVHINRQVNPIMI